jgi:hypothetical protein
MKAAQVTELSFSSVCIIAGVRGADMSQRYSGANNPAGNLLTRRTASSFFCRCTKSYISSTKTAAAPRYAAASDTAATPAAPAPAEADAATAETDADAAATAATAASAATAAETAATSAAETTATTTAAAATATSAAATMTATSTAAATACYLGEAGDATFLVEEVECSQTDVGYFLFAENEALIGRCVQGLWKVCSRNRRCGCASCQRKAKSGGT